MRSLLIALGIATIPSHDKTIHQAMTLELSALQVFAEAPEQQKAIHPATARVATPEL
jgi:hypothetical protein